MKGNRSTEEVEAIYHRHIKMVYQICLMLMKNVPDAEDAAQTVFRKVMEYPKPFRDPEHEKAWLIVTARNECKNQLKHWWRTRRADESVLNTLTWEQPEDGALWELILSLPENRGKIALFGGVKNARFRRQVVPGDVLTLECELVEQHGPVGIGKATAWVDGVRAANAELTFVLADA